MSSSIDNISKHRVTSDVHSSLSQRELNSRIISWLGILIVGAIARSILLATLSDNAFSRGLLGYSFIASFKMFFAAA